MAKDDGKADKSRYRYPAPFSLRLTDEEREELDKLAEGLPWGEYIRGVIFVEMKRPRRHPGKAIKDRKLLAKLLGMLGKSRISQNINQLAKASNSGSLPVTPDTKKALMDAARAVQSMRTMLIEAMGVKPHHDDDHNEDGA